MTTGIWTLIAASPRSPRCFGSQAVLADEDHEPPRGGDREQVQQDGLERQDQRAERAGEQKEGEADQRDQQRKLP